MNNDKYMLVFGASIVDIFGFCDSKYKGSDSNPGRIKISFGGVSRNIAENMARVGVKTKFISIIGEDETGRAMLDHSLTIGYDMTQSMILKKKSTPTYMAIINEEGEMVSAVADLQSISEMTTEFVDSKAGLFEGALYTFLDADDPHILEYILNKYKGKTKFILDPVSSKKAEKIKHLIPFFHTIKPNRIEAEMLCGFKVSTNEELIRAAEHFHSLGVKNVFISLDEDGIFYSNGEKKGRMKAEEVIVRNVTGAGDSFVAGLGFGYYNNYSIEETSKFAIAMSIVTISHEETINPMMNYENVLKMIEYSSWKEEKFE